MRWHAVTYQIFFFHFRKFHVYHFHMPHTHTQLCKKSSERINEIANIFKNMFKYILCRVLLNYKNFSF